MPWDQFLAYAAKYGAPVLEAGLEKLVASFRETHPELEPPPPPDEEDSIDKDVDVLRGKVGP